MVQSEGASPVVEKVDDLIAWMACGEKPPAAWRLGVEHEKIPFRTEDLGSVPYAGARGVRALLEGMAARFGWEPVCEEGAPIALRRSEASGGGSITLEPGGQFELSGALKEDVHQVCDEVAEHRRQVLEVAEGLGIGFLALGFAPILRQEDAPAMPKGRYAIMTRYMPTRGGLGLHMMYRTATAQVNLDYASEADMRQKMRVAVALQPVATALFANSPFVDSALTGWESSRARVWTDTDPDRTGMMPFVFEAGFGYARWVEYLLDVPMYFVARGSGLVDVAGSSFRDFMAGRLAALPGERPTLADWEDHATTAFPEARIKRHIETRGADTGPPARVCALAALWAGLLYDAESLAAAWALVRGWSASAREALRYDAARAGLSAATPDEGTMADLAAEVVAIARAGLRRRARLDAQGRDETRYLAPLEAIVAARESPARRLVRLYNEVWGQDMRRVFVEARY